jgi:hypothetical protein
VSFIHHDIEEGHLLKDFSEILVEDFIRGNHDVKFGDP